MVKRLLLAALLAVAPAAAAVNTTTINGNVVMPNGAAATAGTVKFTLSSPGTTLDGSTSQLVATETTCTIIAAGAIAGPGGVGSCALVPNDGITPAGTYYLARFSVSAPIARTWDLKLKIDVTPDPVNVGAITRIDVPPGITVGPFVQVVDAEPSGACTTLEMPRFARSTNRLCDCDSGSWACPSSGGGSVSDAAYNATTWNGDTTNAPSKNAARDQFELQNECSEISGCVVGALAVEVDGSTTNELQNLFQTIDASSGTDPVADANADTLTITGGTGITVTGNSTTDTLTIATSALLTEVDGSTTNEIQNLFQTIDAPSGTDPVADSSTDTLTLTAGGGVTVTGDATTDTVTIAAVDTSATNELQNLFSTVSTTSGTAPVADANADTLTLTAGTGITITGDSSTDTITIAATGGGAFNSADVDDAVWSDGATEAEIQYTYNLSSGTDPVVKYQDNNVDFSTAVTATSFSADRSTTVGGSIELPEGSNNGSAFVGFIAPASIATAGGLCQLLDAVNGTGMIPASCISGGGGTQNLFETINASSGTDPVADATTDTLNMAAGTGITVTGDSSTDTITIATTALLTEVDGSTTNELQNIFQTVDAPAGTDPIADSTTDTLTITTGTGITVTGDSTTDTLAFAVVDQSATNEIQNIFQTVDASSGTDPVADGSTDTLVVTGGTGITVTGDSTTDTLTIATTALLSEVDGSTTNEIEVSDEIATFPTGYSAANFNGATTQAVSQDDLYDLIHTMDADDDGKVDVLDLASAGFVITSAGGVPSVGATSADLAGVLSNETGSGVVVYGTAPTIADAILTGKIDRNNVAVDDDDCTGEQGLFWYDTTDSAFEYCNANSGTPAVLGGGSNGITAGSADNQIPRSVGTTAAVDFPTSNQPTISDAGAVAMPGGLTVTCTDCLTDANVVNTITASNYLPQAGGVMSGELDADALGIEFEPGDALTDCSTFPATGGGIYYDDSEGKLKKCQDNVLTDLAPASGSTTTLAADSGGATTGATVTVTGGAGIATSRAGDTVTLATASGEQNFLAAGVLTCASAADSGKALVTAAGTPLQYCDTTGTTLRYAAYGNSSGASTAVMCGSVCISDSEVDGNITIQGGAIDTTPIALVQSATPAPTVEGRIEWDTDDNRIVVGDGAAAQTFYPGPHTTDTGITALTGEVTASGNGSQAATIADNVTVTGWVMGASTANLAGADTNTTALATTSFVQQEINGAGQRSLTCASGNCDADVELYTRIESIAIDNPVAGDSGTVQLMFPTAVTLTRVACSTDVGTVSIQFDERAAATPNTAGSDIFSAALSCTTTQAATTTFGGAGTAAVAARVPLNLVISSPASTPTKLRIFVEYTIDD